jgi:hypothetical protein
MGKSDSRTVFGRLEYLMTQLIWLSDRAWAAIEPRFPKNQPGGGSMIGE